MKVQKISILLLLLFFIPVYGFSRDKGESKALIEIDFFTKIKSFSKLSEHKGEIFFVLRQPDKEENTYKSDLYQLKDGDPIRITNSGDVSEYFFIDDSQIVKALRDIEDKEKK